MNQITPPTSHNLPEFSVSQVSTAIKRTVEDNFSYVRVRGEISGAKRAPSGHVYLNLKDDSSVLAAICWKGVAASLECKPEDGLEVIATGRITTYPGRSTYQLIIDKMEPAGVGALMALLEQRKKQFAAEGLFDESSKKEIPFLPDVIGVVTSPTGAVIKDIIHRIEERFPRNILIWPVRVQGDGAAEEIAAAINGFNNLPESDGKYPRPNVIIVARGGGSIEDLWAFNEEIVVRAAANSAIPIISAVGHETDTTLIDYVSDRRAPTPTGAAEMAVPVRSELILLVDDLQRRKIEATFRFIEHKNKEVRSYERLLPKPKFIVEEKAQNLDRTTMRLSSSLNNMITNKNHKLMSVAHQLQHPRLIIKEKLKSLQHNLQMFDKTYKRLIERKEQSLELLSRMLESVNYNKTLQRGFAVITNKRGKLISSIKQINPADKLVIELADGKKNVTADGSIKTKNKKNKLENQDSLF